jgi:hypothetical protein
VAGCCEYGNEPSGFSNSEIISLLARRFDSRWCYWNFSLTSIFRPHYGPGVGSVSSNENQRHFPGGKGGRCVGLATLPPSCADCLEILELQTPGALMACNRPV